MRYALLRDLDTKDLDPFGVLLEREDGGAVLLTYDCPPASMGLRAEYPVFDAALDSLSRSFLVSALGREGDGA
jgi:hypothetical protein